ncbi:uncharacterized protein BYT42DRAFT_552950 [Radiomyces spectabilis]|uniref:uncharacterized protein n=1 Tax=Radiomyces spectabilis TaxID=64574 RepID=UPI0022201958|nr:uncharacterized protein BYT42DRAFT_552950 [Radiomyces spectabilis]KAI8393984.1 hypothetical protein BYT42DRAFT_552950 [Radiomyces spectabilis]
MVPTPIRFVKGGKELKGMVDCLVNANVKDPVVCGILVQGFNCATYWLELKSDGVYVLTCLGKSALLRSPMDLPLVPSIVEHWIQL